MTCYERFIYGFFVLCVDSEKLIFFQFFPLLTVVAGVWVFRRTFSCSRFTFVVPFSFVSFFLFYNNFCSWPWRCPLSVKVTLIVVWCPSFSELSSRWRWWLTTRQWQWTTESKFVNSVNCGGFRCFDATETTKKEEKSNQKWMEQKSTITNHSNELLICFSCNSCVFEWVSECRRKEKKIVLFGVRATTLNWYRRNHKVIALLSEYADSSWHLGLCADENYSFFCSSLGFTITS